MAFSQQQEKTRPLGIFKILREAFKLSTKSFTLILPILIIYFASSNLLSFVTFRSIPDLTSKLTSIASVDPKNPDYAQLTSNILEYLKDASPLLSVLFITSFLLSSLLNIAAIHGFTFVRNSSKHPTHSDLFHNLCGGLKGPMITSLYAALLKLGYVLLVLAIFVASIAQGSLVLIAFGVITVLVSPFLYLYLSMVWSVSVVAAVVEDGCYGWEAISRAWKITKGRRIRGVLLTLVGLAIAGAVSSVYDFMKGYVNSLSTTEKMGIGFVYGLVFLVIRTFEWATSMVFYDDCKRVNGEEGNKEDEGGFMYVSLPTKACDEV